MVLLPFPIQQDFGTWSRYGEQPTPPTPPTKRKRKQMKRSPLWGVGNEITVRDYEKFGGVATDVTVEQVIEHTPRVYGRTFDPVPLYVVRYRDGSVLIANEDALSAMMRQALKKNARPVQAPSAITPYVAAQNANSDTAA